jgi:hypothetical protein
MSKGSSVTPRVEPLFFAEELAFPDFPGLDPRGLGEPDDLTDCFDFAAVPGVTLFAGVWSCDDGFPRDEVPVLRFIVVRSRWTRWAGSRRREKG